MKFFVCLILTICTKTSTSLPISTTTHASTGIIEPHNIKLNDTPIPKEEKSKYAQNLESKESGIEFHDVLDDDEEVAIAKSTTEDATKLNMRCQQIYKLLFPNKPHYKSPNYEEYIEENRPIYVTSQKPTTRPSTTRPSSFYITAPSVNNRQTISATSPIKYIRLEPVILQKTILSNGKTVYYWHKSLPTAVEYPETIAKEDTQQHFYNPYYYYPQYYPGGLYYPNVEKKNAETTTEAVTTTTEETGFGLSNIFPFYGSSSINSTEPPTTISTESSYTRGPEDVLNRRLNFVVPYYYQMLIKSPWGYQPLDYYQKIPPQYYRLPYNYQYQSLRESRHNK